MKLYDICPICHNTTRIKEGKLVRHFGDNEVDICNGTGQAAPRSARTGRTLLPKDKTLTAFLTTRITQKQMAWLQVEANRLDRSVGWVVRQRLKEAMAHDEALFTGDTLIG